jgi:hypothetical protein
MGQDAMRREARENDGEVGENSVLALTEALDRLMVWLMVAIVLTLSWPVCLALFSQGQPTPDPMPAPQQYGAPRSRTGDAEMEFCALTKPNRIV